MNSQGCVSHGPPSTEEPNDRKLPADPRRRGSCMLAGLVCLIVHTAVAQTCAPGWATGPGTLGGVGGTVYTSTTWDPDGPGPTVPIPVLGGGFGVAFGSPSGNSWYLNGPVHQANVSAFACVDFDGPGPAPCELVAAGWFVDPAVGSAPLARWDGTRWLLFGADLITPTPTSFADINGLCAWDPDGSGPGTEVLIVAGDFIAPCTPPGFGVAAYSGAWAPLSPNASGGTTQGTVGMAVATWDDDGTGPHAPGLVLSETNPFTIPNTNRVTFWLAGQSTVLAGAFNAAVQTFAAFDEDGIGPQPPRLFAAGTFAGVNGQLVPGFARWNGANWGTPPAGPSPTTGVACMLAFDLDGPGPLPEQLVVGGRATAANGGLTVSTTALGPSGWTSVGSGFGSAGPGSTPGSVNTLVSIDIDGIGPAAPRLLAAGAFDDVNGHHGQSVAIWGTGTWGTTGTGPNTPPNALSVFDPDGTGPGPSKLYISSPPLTTFGNFPTDILAWDGSSFQSLSATPTGLIHDLLNADIDGPGPIPARLYASGRFGSSPLPQFQHVVEAFDGTTWTPLPTSTTTLCRAMTMYDDDGPGPNPARLTTAGTGTPASYDGSSWTPLGVTGPNGTINTLSAFDDDGPGPGLPLLYAAGGFTNIAGLTTNSIMRWNGFYWWTVGAGLFVNPGGGVPGTANAMVDYDPDGPGPLPHMLVVGGVFGGAGSLAAIGIAAWNGTAWSNAFGNVMQANGNYGTISALAVVDLDSNPTTPGELVATGDFISIGGVAAASIAHWDGFNWSAFGSGLGGATAAPYFPYQQILLPGGNDIAVYDEDGTGAGNPGMYVSGVFVTAGGHASTYLARWGVDPSTSLSLATAGPGTALSIMTSACVGFSHAFTAFSLDPSNALSPGTGPWFGLHISVNDLVAQYQFASPPFVGTLDAFGLSSSVVPAATIAPLVGQNLFAVSVLYDPSTLTAFGVSPVAFVQL